MEQNRTPQAKPPRRRRRRNSGWRTAGTVLKLFLLLGGMGAALAGGIVTGYVAALVKDEPVRSREEIQQKIFSNYLTGFAYYSDGTLIGQLRAEEDRRLVKLSEVSPYLINAIIATEDKDFFNHPGVNFKSTLRAMFQELTHQPVVTGGSTITQQLVKNTLLSREVTHERKAKEIFDALRIERMFTKPQILEAYLNEISFGKNANGSNIYGVQAAAKGIFNKDAKDLTLAEASYIAGMPQNPFGYSPFTSQGYRLGRERQKIVLERMLESGYITQAQYEEALNTDLKPLLAKPSRRAYADHPFLMMEIEERAAAALLDQELLKEGQDPSTVDRGEYQQRLEEKRREILRNGYHIYTTINKDVNQIMENVAADPHNFGPNASYTVRRSNGTREQITNALEEVGAMVIHNKTGAILGMIGGRDFHVEQTNHATAPRQPGSAMKPLAAYGPAFELGYLQPGSPIDDSPILLADGQKGSHLPLNWDLKFHGIISAREALRMSWNVPAIKTYLKVGIPKALEFVKKMGITTLTEEDNHAATGVIGGLSYGLTVEEITNAYATFANEGSFIDAYMIDRIEDAQGKVVYRHEIRPVPVFSPQTAYLMTDMMRTVVNSGTGASIRRYVPRSVDVAGKTGTTNDSNDLWFVGYTPELSMGVWIGYDEPHPLPDSEKTRPMQIWGKVMKQVIDKEPSLSSPSDTFARPSGIVSLTVDSKSGLLPTDLSREAGHLVTDLFDQKHLPDKADDLHQRARVVTYKGERYLAKEGTPDDFVTEGIFFKSPEPLLVTAEQILAKNRKAGTKPLDWDQRLPDKEDPRTDQSGAPKAPDGLTVTASGGHVTLTWKAGSEPDLLGYRVYRLTRSGEAVKIATIKDPATTTYTGPAAADARGYYVTAVDVSGQESPPSAESSSGKGGSPGGTTQEPAPATPNPSETPDGEEPQDSPGTPADDAPSGVPSAPQHVAAHKAAGGVKLTWAANPAKDDVLAYNVYYSRDPAKGGQLLDTVAGTSYVDHNKETGGWYWVTAVNSYGESHHSAYVKRPQ